MDTATSTREEQYSALLDRARKRVFQLTGEPTLDYESQHIFNDRMRSVEETLNEFNDEVIKKVYVATGHDSPLSKELITLLTKGYRSWVIHEHLTFAPLIPNHKYQIIIIGALHYYGELPRVDDYADCDPLITEQAAAIVVAAAHLHEYSTTASKSESWIPVKSELHRAKISKYQIVQLIMEYPSEAKRIAEVIIERKATDAQTIRSVIESSSPSLSRGTL